MSDRVTPYDHPGGQDIEEEDFGVPAPLKERAQSINITAKGSLSGFDKDGDGKITRDELEDYVSTHMDTVKEKALLKKALIGICVLFVLFTGVIGM
jgi:hypothetical protein